MRLRALPVDSRKLARIASSVFTCGKNNGQRMGTLLSARYVDINVYRYYLVINLGYGANGHLEEQCKSWNVRYVKV